MSVPHTGTNFTCKLFRDKGWEVLGISDRPSTTHHTLHHGHIVKMSQIAPAVKMSRDMPLIVPLRHPYLVEESWKRRGKSTEELVQCYELMLEHFSDAHYFAIGSDRDTQLQALSDYMDTRLTTDWTPQNSKADTHSLNPSKLSPSPAIQGLMGRYPFLGHYR